MRPPERVLRLPWSMALWSVKWERTDDQQRAATHAFVWVVNPEGKPPAMIVPSSDVSIIRADEPSQFSPTWSPPRRS